MKRETKFLGATFIVLSASLTPALAQQEIKRTPLGTMDFPAGYQTVMGLAEVGPNICSGRHMHPGIETSYVLEGDGVVKIDGRPDQHVKVGEPIQIPANVPHDACAGAAGVKTLTVHVIEKGKPLGSPSP